MDLDRISIQSGMSGIRTFEKPGSDIRLTGFLKKLKTMKKKFFVLRSTSSSGPARLEYYDSEKKFQSRLPPKRSIHLHTCFNINRKSDSRHKNAIALYTKDECFSVICEDEKELDHWLQLMLEYQNEYINENERPKEHYEYVWQVNVQPKGLGQTKNIKGPYRLCMTRQHICLVKLNAEKPQYDFQLETVRSLAHNDNLFRMEVGKIAPTGEGELWMQTEDASLAQNLHETILNFMKNMERRHDNQEFRQRLSSENFTSTGRPRNKLDPRPTSVHTGVHPGGAVRSSSQSHIHHTISASPGTSPLAPSHYGFDQHPGALGPSRYRSDSQGSRSSYVSAPDDLDTHPPLIIGNNAEPLQEEEDWEYFERGNSVDHQSIPSSPGSHVAEADDFDGQVHYMDMRSPGSVTPPTPGKAGGGYMDMTPTALKEPREMWENSSYMAMNPTWPSSAPINIHPGVGEPAMGCYMEMSNHGSLPTVREGGSAEGYVPMSPSYSTSLFGSSRELKPDRVVCMLTDDSGGEFQTQTPTRTYSLGSRPVKAPQTKYSGYVDMSARKGVSDNGRSCSAPHLITNHPHNHHYPPRSRNSNVDSPTPSASPLSTSLRSDDSDYFMELDFYRQRTASDSYSYRPRAASFGMSQKNGSLTSQGHRPRSSSHGQGTRPMRGKNKVLDPNMVGRLGHDLKLTRSQASSSHGSFDSLKVSSSESLRKLSQEVRTKTSQLNTDYMDMGFEKRHTPSPQPASSASSKSGQNGYVDMSLGQRKSSPSRSRVNSHSNSKTSSAEKLQQEPEYTDMTLGSGGSGATPTQDSVYVNYESQDKGAKKGSPSRSSSSENMDTYIMYEPATTPTRTSPNLGKGAIPKTDSPSQDPRNRSGSGGKEQKKRGGFFSLRHASHGDSSSSKPSKKAEQTGGGVGGVGGANYSSTGGDKFGSLGRNVRHKSKDSSAEIGRSGGHKSHSFSRAFGNTATKPGKIMRKTPTPPKSLDGNDEYIEFSPMAVKSDSDSSHSSGSTHLGSRSKSESKDEAEYVGFEPGNINSSGSSQRSNASSGYVPMGVGGSGGGGGGGSASGAGNHSAVFKPVKKSDKAEVKRSKSREDGASHLSSSSPVSTCTPTPTPTTAHNLPGPAVEQEKTLQKPLPVYPASHSEAGLQLHAVHPVPDIPPIPALIPVPGVPTPAFSPTPDVPIPAPAPTPDLQLPPLPATSVAPTLPIPPLPAVVVPVTVATGGSGASVVPEALKGRSSAPATTTAAAAAPMSYSWALASPNTTLLTVSVTPVPVASTAASSSPTAPTTTSLAPASLAATSSASSLASSSSSTLQPSSPGSSSLPSPSSSNSSFVMVAKPSPSPKEDSGYMDFDPGKTASLSPEAVKPSSPLTSSPSSVSPVGTGGATGAVWGESSAMSSQSLPTSNPVSPTGTSLLLAGERKISGGSRGKSSSGACGFEDSKTKNGASSSQPMAPASSSPLTTSSTDPFSLNPLAGFSPGLLRSSMGKAGVGAGAGSLGSSPATRKLSTGSNGGSGASSKTSPGDGATKSDPRSPRLSQGSGDFVHQGLTRPESSPNMFSMDKLPGSSPSGRGRGRHSSSSSTQGQGKKGKCSNGATKEGNPSARLSGGDNSLHINPEADARHSITDLSGYEVMTFPSDALSQQQPAAAVSATWQQQQNLAQGSGSGSQGVLNYATLDLGSADSMGDAAGSPRNKSRHPSAAEEKSVPLSYATIDFEKSESLREKAESMRNAASKDGNGKRSL